MMNHNFLRIKYFLILPAVFIFAFGAAGNARAKTVTDGNFRITCDDPLFTVANAAPGESFSSDMTVENLGGKDRKFQFELNIKVNPKALAERLFLKIGSLDGAGAFACEYGCAKDENLKDLDGSQFVVKTIPGDSSKNFRFTLTFDPAAGNEFQNASASFDLKLGFKDEVIDDGDGNGGGGPAGAGAPPALGPGTGLLAAVGGVAGEAVVAEEVAPEEQVEGAETGPEGEVMGEEVSLCESWPLWIWILALLIYFAAFSWRTFDKFKEQVEKREIRWGWQAIFAAAAFLFWYFFDFCREYWWFVIIALVGGAAVYLAYLYLFRRAIREKSEKIETGEK